MLKEIEQVFYKFLWNNKPDKVRRMDAEIPSIKGGLSMVCVEKFWTAFKFSWFRRLLNTKAFWPLLLEHTIKLSHNNDYDVKYLTEEGPSELIRISKGLKNQFWKEVFSSAVPIIEGAIFVYPELFLLSPFWNNPQIKRNNKAIKFNNYPDISQKVSKVSDFFKSGGTEFLTLNDFNNKYGLDLNHHNFIEIRYIISIAMQSLGIRVENVQVQS